MAPAKPITLQLNRYDNNENRAVKVGDTVQVKLPDQPSTPFQWKFQKPDPAVFKQVGQPRFFSNSTAIGAKGSMVWTFAVVGTGSAPLIADYQEVPAQAMPVDTWQVNFKAKPGFTPKTVYAVDAYPADTVHAVPGDTIKLTLDSSAGAWSVVSGSSRQLVAAKPVQSGGKTVIGFTAKSHGYATPVLVASASGGYPAQAYAFTATIGQGRAPITIDAAEHHAVKPIVVNAGQTFDIALGSNSAFTGYTWQTAKIANTLVVQQAGEPTIMPPDSSLPGASGVTLMHYKALAKGAAELVLLYQRGADGVPAAMYITMVNVQ